MNVGVCINSFETRTLVKQARTPRWRYICNMASSRTERTINTLDRHTFYITCSHLGHHKWQLTLAIDVRWGEGLQQQKGDDRRFASDCITHWAACPRHSQPSQPAGTISR